MYPLFAETFMVIWFRKLDFHAVKAELNNCSITFVYLSWNLHSPLRQHLLVMRAIHVVLLLMSNPPELKELYFRLNKFNSDWISIWNCAIVDSGRKSLKLVSVLPILLEVSAHDFIVYPFSYWILWTHCKKLLLEITPRSFTQLCV